MGIITLTTDWSKGDSYLPSVLGLLLKKAVGANIIPICTTIEQHNVSQAAFLLKSTFQNFPEGTIHLVGVDYVSDDNRKYIAIEWGNQTFVGPDNGIFSLLFEGYPEKIFQINEELYIHPKMKIFPELHILANAAGDIYSGKKIEDIGIPLAEMERKVEFIPTIDEDIIIGKIIYIDSYQNAITNISQDLFNQIGQNRDFTIYVKSRRDKINQISQSYSESSDGELIALFNTADLLELAMVNAGAAPLFNLDTNSTIRINFHDNKNSETDY